MARFLMNAMFASGGYSWTVIDVDHRADYMSAFESASAGGDIVPFAQMIEDRMQWSCSLSKQAN
jgi:hypothetical protein